MAKNNNLKISDFFKSYFNLNLLSSNLSSKSLGIYSIILLLLVSFENLLINLNSANGFSMKTSFLYTLFGFPLVILFIFGLIYLFVGAYDPKLKIKFCNSFVFFFFISMQYYIIGYLLEYFRILSINSNTLYLLFSLLIYILAIYYIYVIIRALSNYFNQSKTRVFVSLILTYITILTFAIINYLLYLIGNLG